MAKKTYEVELKTLLKTKDKADELLENLKKFDPNLYLINHTKRLNDYFIKGDFNKLIVNIEPFLSDNDLEKIKEIINEGNNHSVRTRQLDENVFLIIKASVDDTTSENGVARWEFEGELKDLSLDQLNEILLNSDFETQARWSQERDEYKFKDLDVSISFSPGYGYVSEFEKIVEDLSQIDETKKYIEDLMDKVGVVEFDHDLIERMFKFYNENWIDFYGTNKTFSLN